VVEQEKLDVGAHYHDPATMLEMEREGVQLFIRSVCGAELVKELVGGERARGGVWGFTVTKGGANLFTRPSSG